MRSIASIIIAHNNILSNKTTTKTIKGQQKQHLYLNNVVLVVLLWFNVVVFSILHNHICYFYSARPSRA